MNKQLPQNVRHIIHQAGTEPPFSSPLLNEKRHGTYLCVSCDNPLFSSQAKYNSNSGWPSFYQSIQNATREKNDHSHNMIRTETLCAQCGAHLGHVFDDGPPPTGLRYCINGLALTFDPQ